MYARVFSVSALAAGALAQTITGKTQCEAAGAYQLCQNLWGTSAATSGSQSSNLVSASGNSVSWSTTWTWAGGPNSVKSYANVQSSTAKGMTLASIASAPTAWSWSYASVSSDVRADVSYDIWLGTTPDGAPASSASTYEIMIWLSGRGGIQPVGSQAQTGINIGGHTWTLWSGPNTNWHVYSFVSASGDINSFSGDLNAFFQWLEANEGVSKSLYLQAVQTGTEPFEGSAQLVTSSYSVSVTTGSGGGGGSTTTTPHSTTTSTPGSSPSGCTAAHYAQCGGTGFTGCTTCASGYTCKASSQYYSQCL